MSFYEYYKHNIENKPADPITRSVIEDLRSRAERGLKKYNTTLGENNTDDFLQHLYEELLDAAQYIKKEITIRKNIQQLVEEHPNDAELGEIIRITFGRK